MSPVSATRSLRVRRHGLDNQYVVDGVHVTNTGYGAHGSYSIVFGSLGPPDWSVLFDVDPFIWIEINENTNSAIRPRRMSFVT